MVLKHQTAIVTGGSRGIGKAIALHLSAQGFNIVLSFKKDEKAAAQVVSDIQKSGGAAEMIRADLSLADSANDITRTTIERFGRIDVLINNAGVSSNKSLIADTPDLEWNEIIDVNLHGVFRMMKAVVPRMRQQKKGNIVNLSSNITKRLAPTFGPYAISKAALETPTPLAATFIRPSSKPAKICFNPCPSTSPIKFEAGTFTLSNCTSPVSIPL